MFIAKQTLSCVSVGCSCVMIIFYSTPLSRIYLAEQLIALAIVIIMFVALFQDSINTLAKMNKLSGILNNLIY